MVTEQRGCSTASAEMTEYVQRVGKQPSELSVEDWNLRAAAYESTAGSCRAAWRIIAGVEQKEKFKDMEQQTSHAREYVAKVEHEIQKIHEGFDENLIPKWLNAVRGVVDSGDPPLNVYRETLLQNKILRVVKKNHVKKCLEMLAQITELSDDCEKFYEKFGKCLSLGIHEAELLRFNTFEPGDEQISFKEYKDQLAMDTKFLQSLKTRCSETEEDVNVCVQHEVEEHVVQEKINQETKRIEIPMLQFMEMAIDIPVGAQKQISMVTDVRVVSVVQVPRVWVVKNTVEDTQLQVVEKTFEIPELQFTDKVVILVVTQRQIHMNPDVQKTIEIPQLQHTDDVVDVPVPVVAQVPRVEVVEEAVEIGVVPETFETSESQLEVMQTSESLNTTFLRRVTQADIGALSMSECGRSAGMQRSTQQRDSSQGVASNNCKQHNKRERKKWRWRKRKEGGRKGSSGRNRQGGQDGRDGLGGSHERDQKEE